MSNTNTASTSSKTIRLKTRDDQIFEVAEAVAIEAKTIKHLIEDTSSTLDDENTVIPIHNVTAKIMSKTLQYLNERHAISSPSSSKEGLVTPYYRSNANENNEKITNFEEGFVKEVTEDQEVLFDLILAANYLHIQSLLDLLCKAVADMMKGKTPKEIRDTFHIVNDYTPEEEEEVRRENQWAFE